MTLRDNIRDKMLAELERELEPAQFNGIGYGLAGVLADAAIAALRQEKQMTTDEPVFDRLEDTDDHVFETNAIVQVHRANLRYQLVEAPDGSRYWKLLGPGRFGPMTTVGRPTQRVEFRKRIDLRPPVVRGWRYLRDDAKPADIVDDLPPGLDPNEIGI